MPNRIIREGILDSERVDKLSWAGEVFYRRLHSVVDDYGCFDGRPEVLRTKLFPIRTGKVTVTDIGKWLGECSDAGLVSCYTVSGKPYIEVMDFHQHVRIKKRKYPDPQLADKNDTQMHSIRMSETKPIQSIPNTNSGKAESVHPVAVYSKSLKRVSKMEDQLTDEEAEKLVKQFGESDVRKTLANMDNYKPLVKNNASVYRTCGNWITRDREKKASLKNSGQGINETGLTVNP